MRIQYEACFVGVCNAMKKNGMVQYLNSINGAGTKTATTATKNMHSQIFVSFLPAEWHGKITKVCNHTTQPIDLAIIKTKIMQIHRKKLSMILKTFGYIYDEVFKKKLKLKRFTILVQISTP